MRSRRLLWLSLLLICSWASAYEASVSWPIAPGVRYATGYDTDGPWEVRVLRVDRTEPAVRLDVALAEGHVRGVEALSQIIARESRADDYVVAGVNADFFSMAHQPGAGSLSGMTVRRGEVITISAAPAFCLLADGTPLILTAGTQATLETPTGEAPVRLINHGAPKSGVCLYTRVGGWAVEGPCVALSVSGLPLTLNGEWEASVSEVVARGARRRAGADEIIAKGFGDSAGALDGLPVGAPVRVRLQTPEVPGPVELAVGGGPVLLRGGKVVASDDVRHPRTAVGYNEREIILATVDGRQRGWSAGMSLGELALLMLRLGCTDALNLDGGGSTTAWVRGEVVNRPSDGGERRIANGLLVRSVAPRGPAARMLVSPAKVAGPPGSRVPVRVWLTDEWFNPVPADQAEFRIAGVEPVRSGPAPSVSWADGMLSLDGGPGQALVLFAHPSAPGVSGELSVVVQ
jgi:hypothetical protein